MRLEIECEDFAHEAHARIIQACPACGGLDASCKECYVKFYVETKAFEACIPRDFWWTTEADVTHNVEAFREVVLPYTKRLKLARRNGYGLALLGDNGVGKTMFLSHVLIRAIRRGFTAYYATLPQLDHHLKRGISDRAVMERLDWMLTSDFLAVDEMGKERFKDGDSWMRLQIERILKDRFDNSMPTLIATNADMEALTAMYGATIGSILVGKYQTVTLPPGDFRERPRKKMTKDMGFK